VSNNFCTRPIQPKRIRSFDQKKKKEYVVYAYIYLQVASVSSRVRVNDAVKSLPNFNQWDYDLFH